MAITSSQLVSTLTTCQPSQCSCDRCQELCHITPCLGTPEDIQRLVAEGYLDQLSLTEWHAGHGIGIPGILMVQITAEECGRCPLLKEGRCSVHEFKPTEGRLASHTPTPLSNSPGIAVAMTWLLPRNAKLIAYLITLFYK